MNGVTDSKVTGATPNVVEALERQVHVLHEGLSICEEALSESEERFRATFHESPVAIAIIAGAEKRFFDMNEAFLALTGYERSALIGEEAGARGLGLLPEQPGAPRGFGRAEQAPPDVEHQIQTAGGQTRTVLVATKEVELFGEAHLLCTFYDVTRRTQLERDVLRIDEETRRRIASDLHDDLGQQLVAAAFQTDALSDALEARGLAEAAARAQRIASATRAALEHVRGLSCRLAPVPLAGPDGLADALARLAERIEETFSIPCCFHARAPVQVDDHETALHLYRIAQEATTNAVKHAAPSQVTVSLATEGQQRLLRVRDDGAGLDEDALAGRHGLGLRTMQYRADLIGAAFRLAPAEDGSGTVVECRLR